MGDFNEDITQSQCVQEFLNFLKANPFLLSSYKTMVNTVVASLDQQIAQYNLIIFQLSAIASIDETAVNSYLAIVKQVTSILSPLHFEEFKTCPGISQLVNLINTQIDPYNIPLVGNVKNIIYESKRRRQYINKLQLDNDKRSKLKKDLQNTLNSLI